MARPNRWAEVVEAAGEEFRIRGYDSATLEDIAARVGILKGSIYNYVQNKEELLFAVIEQPAKRILEELTILKADTDHSVAYRLQRLFQMQVRVFCDHYPAAFVYLRNIGRSDLSEKFGAYAELDTKYIRMVEDLIAEGVERGELNISSEPRVAARAIIGILDWMQHWFVPHHDERDQAIADDLFAIALGGLHSSGGIAHMLRD
ncbi:MULTISPECIES: TetR/AcrR family transcriptional regulator [Gordonia]|uniref:TetR/AcrR family transcriptional regulator n=1 Tax=Gordonia TaxID=2053 RepID=UPI001444B1BE|nr:TetR/AcrR family transcriptional regulator [Gordonia paraffinivorans]